MTALRFPAEIAVGEVWWGDIREPDGSGHLLAIGVVEVPDGTAVNLSVYTVAEVSVSDQPGGMFVVPAGTESLRGWRVWVLGIIDCYGYMSRVSAHATKPGPVRAGDKRPAGAGRRPGALALRL